MVAILRGRLDWGLQRTPENGREYGITWLLRTTNPDDGPSTVMLCPDLPQVGDIWEFGTESDPWAFCRPDWTIDCIGKGEPGIYWTVSQTFSTRPLRRCQDFQFDNPLLEPPDISGTFNREMLEIIKNNDGSIPKTSSHDRITGDIMKFDNGKPTISISFNDSTLGMDKFTEFQDTVNDAPLWGFEKRCVKLSNTTWKRNIYGMCTYYWTKTHEFEIDVKTFDREYLDIGTCCLMGWSPGSTEPVIDPLVLDPSFGNLPKWMNRANFERYKTASGDYLDRVPLDGVGRPVIDTDEPATGLIYHYPEKNFLELGIPSSIE